MTTVRDGVTITIIAMPPRDDETRELARAVVAPPRCPEAQQVKSGIHRTRWLVTQALYTADDCRTEAQLREALPADVHKWIRTALRDLMASHCVASHPDPEGKHYYLTDNGVGLAEAN